MGKYLPAQKINSADEYKLQMNMTHLKLQKNELLEGLICFSDDYA